MIYLIADWEATCIAPLESVRKRTDSGFVSEIIEFAGIFVTKDYKILYEFDRFVKPIINTKLSDFCTSLTTIKQSDVDKADTFPIVYQDFVEACTDYFGMSKITFCSWGDYDRKQLAQDCVLHKVPYPFIHPHVNLKTLLSEKLGLKRGLGLRKAVSRSNLIFQGTQHRGIDDCRNIIAVCKHFDVLADIKNTWKEQLENIKYILE